MSSDDVVQIEVQISGLQVRELQCFRLGDFGDLEVARSKARTCLILISKVPSCLTKSFTYDHQVKNLLDPFRVLQGPVAPPCDHWPVSRGAFVTKGTLVLCRVAYRP